MDEKMADALRAYLKAQRRMLDRWSEGNKAVKDDLWKELHACEFAGAYALEKYDEKVATAGR